MDPGARRDRLRRHPDDLPVPPHRLTGQVGPQRGLVPRRDALAHHHAAADLRAGLQGGARDHHPVAVVQLDEGRHQPRISFITARAPMAMNVASLPIVTSLKPIPIARLA